MDPAAETTHVVVWFTASRSVKGKSLVDLVPKSWIIQEGTRNFCLYPDESDYDKLDDWVKNSKLPVPTWSRSVVTIVKSAVGYQQGLRRLQRSFENIDVVESSTDVESCSDVEAIKTKQVKTKSLKATAVKEAFNNIPPFPIDDNVEKTVEETEIIHHTSTKTKGSITAAEKKTLEVISSHSKEDTNSGASDSRIDSSSDESHPVAKKSKRGSDHAGKTGDDGPSSHSKPKTSRHSVVSSSDESPPPTNKLKKDSATAEKNPDTRAPYSKSRTSRYAEIYSSTDESPPSKKRKNGTPPAEKVSGTPHKKSKPLRRKLQLTTPSGRIDGTDTGKENTDQNSNDVGECCCAMNTAKILKKIGSMKSSMLYDINMKFKSVLDTLAINNDGKTAEDLSKVTTTLGLTKLPIQTKDEFVAFDRSVVEDDTKEKESALMKFMLSKCRRAENLTEGISKILSSIMGKDVQLCYSGCGRVQKGVSKANLSDTSVYKCMRDVLLETRTNCQASDIISKTSRWLAGAGDRDGGKKKRAEKAALEAALKLNATEAAHRLKTIEAGEINSRRRHEQDSNKDE